MKETGIIMSGNHPKLVLDGRKTQTRRVIENKSHSNDYFFIAPPNDKYHFYYRRRDAVWDSFKTIEDLIKKRCPYGQVGDRLWVRETFYPCVDANQKIRGDCIYKAEDDARLVVKGEWKPSTHMPRWASRITLEITEVRVERVQEITVEDAIAEGCVPYFEGGDTLFIGRETFYPARGLFRTLWDSLNAKRGYGWDANPWVWVISFKVLKHAQ